MAVGFYRLFLALWLSIFPPTAIYAETIAGSVDEDYEQWYLNGDGQHVGVGQQGTLSVSFTPRHKMRLCELSQDQCHLKVEVDQPVEVVEWAVNGIVNGDSTVGKILGQGSRIRYLAPGKVPRHNPVAISARIAGNQEMLLVANITVVPGNQWTGVMIIEVSGQHREGTPGKAGYELLDMGYRGAYSIQKVLTDSYEDDGSGIVFLQFAHLNTDFVQYRESRGDCVVISRIYEADDDMDPTTSMTVEISPSHTTRINHVIGSAYYVQGRTEERDCIDGTKPRSWQTDRIMMAPVFFDGPFEGESNNPDVVKGEITREIAINDDMFGTPLVGELHIQWKFTRQ